jgi:hypothetical protein
MALRVPEDQIADIKKLLELPDDKLNEFVDALGNAGLRFNMYDLSNDLSRILKLPRELTLGIISVLVSLYHTRDEAKPVGDFVDKEVFAAIKRAKALAPENEDAQWKRLSNFLKAALSSERTLGTAAKAGPVLTHHERIFTGAQIMTDLRPIYHVDVSEKPEAAVVVHMLQIGQRDSFNHRAELYFALDSNDIAELKEIIERAMRKEKTLRNIMENSGITVLDPGRVY